MVRLSNKEKEMVRLCLKYYATEASHEHSNGEVYAGLDSESKEFELIGKILSKL